MQNSSSSFLLQWANRHDGECEAPTVEARAREIVRAGWNLTHNWMELPATANDLIREVSRALGCHCYRRWLEGRLGEISAVLRHITEQCVYHSNALLSPKDAE